MESVLVTGGNGFIGKHLVNTLLKDNHVVIVDTRPRIDPGLKEGNATFYLHDIRDKAELSAIIEKEKVTKCIHLAAKVSVSESIRNPSETLDINVNGTLSVLEACAQKSVHSLIFASSAAVYGEPQSLPIPEDHPLRPLSPYGLSKALGEMLVNMYHTRGLIQNIVNLRFFNVYGEGQNPSYAGVITEFAHRLSDGLAPVIYGDGTYTRDFISVRDVVSAIVLTSNFYGSGTFNIGSGVPMQIGKLAERMVRLVGSNMNPVYLPKKEGDMEHSYADISKAAAVLGFKAMEKLDYVLEEILKPVAGQAKRIAAK